MQEEVIRVKCCISYLILKFFLEISFIQATLAIEKALDFNYRAIKLMNIHYDPQYDEEDYDRK